MVAAVDSPLSHFTFPRTGKRGVPQQFPRRLYEMLESETNHFEQDPNYKRVISWSESGKAFRIFDVAEFSDSILPKYFRTKKFSSFQRNLNLVSRPRNRNVHLRLNLLVCSHCHFNTYSTASPRLVEVPKWTCTPIPPSSEMIPSLCSS